MVMPCTSDTPLSAASVLHVITRYAAGGSERRLQDAIAATPELQHRIVVGAEHDHDRLRRDLPGVAVEVLHSLIRAPHPWNDTRAYHCLSSRLRHANIDLVHTHQSKAGALGRLAAWRGGIPAVHSLSMANFGEGFGTISNTVFRNIERVLSRHTACYAVAGTDLRDRYVSAGIDPSKFLVIRSSIDLDAFRMAPTPEDASQALGLSRRGGVIAYVGRFERLKGVEQLPRFLAEVTRRRGCAPALVLAGEGPLRRTIVDRCIAIVGPSAVVDLGYTDRVPEVLAAADVIVLLSSSEGVPQVLVQALASHRPFVSYAADGARELASRSGAAGCWIVPIGDTTAASLAALAVLEHPMVPNANVNEWSPVSVRQCYRDLYRRILASPLSSAINSPGPDS